MLFKAYVPTSIHGIYNIMCSIEAHKRKHKLVNDEEISGGDRTLSSNSKEEALIPFGITNKFIESCLKSLGRNVL